MQRQASVTGTIVKILIIWAVLYLLISVWVFALRNLSVFSTSTTSTASDSLSLAELASLSFDNSNTSSDLLDSQFWDTVLASSGKTVVEILPSTVYGLIQSSNQWRDFLHSNMDSPPSWLANSPSGYTSGLIQNLSIRVMGARNAASAAQVMDNFTQYTSGLSLALVDALTFNGVSAFKQYLQTGNIFEAGLTTVPGQIYDLFSISTDPRYSPQFRAQLLGEALAIVSITIVTAGKDGFGLKFDSMLSRLNLLDAWPKFKAYLMDIGTKSSPAEAYETTVVL